MDKFLSQYELGFAAEQTILTSQGLNTANVYFLHLLYVHRKTGSALGHPHSGMQADRASTTWSVVCSDGGKKKW